MDWQKYAWVKRGKRRRTTLELFNKTATPLTINDVHEKTKIALSQASATIAELERTGLIECLNPKDKIGKLYRITKEGKEIITTLTVA
jgi:DNA-binding MarR family transcriptional regulator